MMKPSLLACLLVFMIASLGALRAAPQREETLFLFENRKVVVAVPAGFSFGGVRDERGLARVQMSNASNDVSVQLTFLPDFEERFMEGYERNRFLFESFSEFAESSVEKAMQFEDLKPADGVGTYCVFTDAKLVGVTTLPENEYLHATKGVKVWPGVLVVFSVFSNDTTSKDYKAIMTMLRESVVEKAVPLR
jgi:hypothetical protein